MNNVYILIALVIALILIFLPGRPRKTQREVEVSTTLDINDYIEKKAEIGHDLMNKIVLETNRYVSEKYNKPTYIIETIAAKKYEHKIRGDVFYRCMFMVIERSGFVSGFTVTADVRVEPKVEVIALTKQPIDVKLPGDTTPYEQSDVGGQQFFEYKLVKEKVTVNANELKTAKNKLQLL